MSLFRTIYSTILDAIFPLSPAEVELFSYSPEIALEKLPPAPSVPIGDAQSIFAYKDERVAKLVWNIKYKKSKQAVGIGGYALYQHISRPTLVIPIPITNRRRRERGFNQCELLVDEIQRLDSSHQFIVIKDFLIRTEHRERQTLKGRKDRLEGAVGIFSVNKIPAEKLPIIIIDDVITTGSTMKEAVETVKKAGFENVRGLSLAH